VAREALQETIGCGVGANVESAKEAMHRRERDEQAARMILDQLVQRPGSSQLRAQDFHQAVARLVDEQPLVVGARQVDHAVEPAAQQIYAPGLKGLLPQRLPLRIGPFQARDQALPVAVGDLALLLAALDLAEQPGDVGLCLVDRQIDMPTAKPWKLLRDRL